MENRKDTLGALKLCRFCLTQDESLRSIYDRNRGPKNSVPLSLKILSCVSIEVFPSDKMPSFICNRCSLFMDLCYEYKQICRQGDETIMQYVQSGTALEPVVWPPSLVKMFRHGAKAVQDVGVVKTVVEGGATVEVTSQDVSDSDEDNEDVYQVKIEDGSDGGSSACVKVVTDTSPQKSRKGFTSVTKLTRHVRSHAGERTYPCKYCDKSFIKSHHYTRHVRLKHSEVRTPQESFNASEQYRCEQCEDCFSTQDELIYHSAIHATQNLTCPLCQEKFENVDDVTTHIKSHVNGVEFMCDFCELVFTSKEKLDNHLIIAHEEELQNVEAQGHDESMESTEMDVDDEEYESGIQVKEEDDHMVVEIKKPDNFLLSDTHGDSEEKNDNINSEESEAEATYTELSTVDTLAIVQKQIPAKVVEAPPPEKLPMATIVATVSQEKSVNSQPAAVLRQIVEVKRTVQPAEPVVEKKPVPKVESSNSVGASDKSLRLLEKELQELKRTNIRNETPKSSVKTMESLRSRRPQLHTSTPKLRANEDKKAPVTPRSATLERKMPERRAVKENKEPKDGKAIAVAVKEEKEVKETKANNTSAKEEKEKEVKDKETPKSTVKNGSADKSSSDEMVRRSTRPSKIKDYARMIRDKSQVASDDDSDDDSDDAEYQENDKSTEVRPKTRRVNVKPPAKAIKTPVAGGVVRKRGRPRKDAQDVPAKIKKDEIEINDGDKDDSKTEIASEKSSEKSADESKTDIESVAQSSTSNAAKPSVEGNQPGKLVSPCGQILKKVPIKSLPPGVKPLPLPLSANVRPMGTGELCEMQIGKKVVKVQKIMVTKAEVEVMAKKGLVEMKGGTMVLKQGIKIPKSDPSAIKTTLVNDDIGKESPSKVKPAPTRVDFSEQI